MQNRSNSWTSRRGLSRACKRTTYRSVSWELGASSNPQGRHETLLYTVRLHARGSPRRDVQELLQFCIWALYRSVSCDLVWPVRDLIGTHFAPNTIKQGPRWNLGSPTGCTFRVRPTEYMARRRPARPSQPGHILTWLGPESWQIRVAQISS